MDRRRRMTVRIVPLDSREAGDPRMGGSVEERVAAVDALTREAWRLDGRTIPSYTRATMPVALRALHDEVEPSGMIEDVRDALATLTTSGRPKDLEDIRSPGE